MYFQIRSLEAWGDMEKQHLSAVSVTKDCLHSVVCRVPLIEGAEVGQIYKYFHFQRLVLN